MADAKVTLAHKKNLRDAEAKKAPLLAKLKATTGVDFEFTTDPKFEDFVVALIKGGNNYHERVGDGLYNDDGYLATVVKFFESACKDEMIKEALVEAIPNKKIILGLTDDWDSATLIQFKDGNMHLYTTPGSFYLYLSYYESFDVTKIL